MADFNFNLKPPDSIPGQAAYGAYGVFALWRRVNGISTSGGGGGTPFLTSTYIGYGNSSNQLTGSSDFYYDPTKEFIVGFSGKRIIKASSDTIILGDVDSAGHNTILSVSDASQSITVGTGTKNVVTTLSNITGIRTRTEPDKDGTYAMTSDITTALTPVPQWVKVATKTFTDFSTAGAANTIASGYLLPANGVITGCQVIPTVAFSGGTIATYTVSVGISSSHLKYAIATNVFTGFTLSAPNVLPGIESTSTTTSITLTATATVGLLNASTAGSVDIWLLVSVLS